jgi:transketolase N-terminal domain/subunit
VGRSGHRLARTGLSLALGMALGSRLDGDRFRVFCLLGDGETQAGRSGRRRWPPASTSPPT